MRNNFCTILNLGYLTRGLVLYHSLARVCPEFRLYVACMDSDSASLLKRLQLPSLTVIEGEQLEAYDPELAAAKSTRGIGDYCKTAKPTLCLYLLEQVPEAELITFLDADLMFFNDPGPMFDELGDDSIMLMPMRRGPKRREEKDKRFGPYNSGTVGFRRAEPGPAALRWWRDRCLEWSPGDHPLLDQPFVSDWPERFEAVHVVEHIGCGVAPWNVFQYRVESENGAPLVDGVPVIFYHYTMFTPFHSVNSFHRTRFLAPPRRFTIGALPLFWQMGAPYGIAPGETELIWEPYVREFGEAILEARRLDPSFTAGLVDAGRPVDESSTARRRRAVSVDRQRGPSAYQAIRAWGRPLEPVWWEPEPGGDQHWEVRVTDEGDLRVECRLPGDEAFYVRQGEEGFHKPPAAGNTWAVSPETFYELTVEANFEDGDITVGVFVIEYDDHRRLQDHRLYLADGVNSLRLTTSAEMSSLRMALRFSGSGTVWLSPLKLSEPIFDQENNHAQHQRSAKVSNTGKADHA